MNIYGVVIMGCRVCVVDFYLFEIGFVVVEVSILNVVGTALALRSCHDWGATKVFYTSSKKREAVPETLLSPPFNFIPNHISRQW